MIDRASLGESMSDIISEIEELRRQDELLLYKYIGEENMKLGRLMTERFARLQWYGNRLYQLGEIKGKFNMARRECKVGSSLFRHYTDAEAEVDRAKDYLLIEFLSFNESLYRP